ncbi:unnamed protein product [Colletotrichum noveboracense]|uniref:Uncharacterized protein n=1 Tax=Colletotrichum noveboracense TaxID=2664923 RepID=A0A9W4S8U8_9PEZI|nr:unnamed protein product [Colletotrichum noveboracense]
MKLFIKDPTCRYHPAGRIAILVIFITLLLCVIAYYARHQVHTFAKLLAQHRAHNKEREGTENEETTTVTATATV